MNRPVRYPPPVRAQAVAQVRQALPDHPSEWSAIKEVAASFNVSTEAVRKWVRQAERIEAETRPSPADDLPDAYVAELHRLQRENTELRHVVQRLNNQQSGAALIGSDGVPSRIPQP